MYRFLVFCIILSSVPYSHSLANTGEKLTAVWNKFWSTSCPLSTIVSRTRRSIELPNIDNSAEIFDYLFPLANVSPEAAGGSRSSSSSSIPTISTWMDDVVDLWQHECQRRHINKSQKRKKRLQKRSSVRNQGVAVTPTPGQTETETGKEDAVITWAGYLGNLSSSFYSSSQQEPDEDQLSFSPPAPAPAAAPGFNPLSFLNADYFTTTITYPDDYEESQSQGNTRKKYDGDVVKDREGDHNDDADIGEDVDADEMEQAESQSKDSFQKSNYGKDEDKTESESDNSEEAEEEEEEDDQNDDDDDEEEETTTKEDDDEATTKSSKSTDTTTAATTTTTTTAAPEDPYFSSYGGDIEYFFPILSFTIPFDGEITLLGFHGFKGMLPY